MGQQDDNKSQPTTTPVLATPDTAKPSLSRRLRHCNMPKMQLGLLDTTRNIAVDALLDALDQLLIHDVELSE